MAVDRDLSLGSAQDSSDDFVQGRGSAAGGTRIDDAIPVSKSISKASRTSSPSTLDFSNA